MLTISEKEMLQQLERMNDRDSTVRRDAIESLTGIKDARVLYPLIKALQDEDHGIQQAAMDALIAFEDESAVYNVLPLLSDSRVYVRNIAREILDKIGGYGIELFGFHIKDKDEDVRKMIADILGTIKRPGASELLMEMLRDPCSNVRSSAAEGLGRIGDSSAVEPLIDLLCDEYWVAFFAAGALGQLRDKRAVKPLIRLIASTNIEVQVMAIEALSSIGGEEAVDGMLEALDSLSPETMNIVVKGIVKLTHGNIEKIIDKFGRDRFFKHLVEAREEIEEADIKGDFIQAFSIVGDAGSSACIFELLAGVETDSLDILQIAVDALKRLADEDTLIGGLKDESTTCVLIAVRVLGLLKSSKAIPSLINLFEDVDRDIKIEILFALAKIGGRESLQFLIDKLSYGEGHIRGAAAQGLGIMGAPEATESLLNRLQHEEYSNVVEEIVVALVEIGHENNIPYLYDGLASNLSSKKPCVRELVVKGLGMLGWAKAAEYVKGMLNDEDWRVRRACLETIGYLNAPELLDVLITAASDEKDEVRMLVAQMAGRYPGEKTADTLISLLTDRNSRITIKAVEGLVRLRAAKAIPYLIELASKGEPPIQKVSIWALGEFAATDAEDILKGALCNKDAEIKAAAIEAYKKLRVVNNVII